MELSKKQLYNFQRLNKKLKTSPNFFVLNFKRVVKQYTFLLNPRYYVCCQQFRKKHGKCVIIYNKFKVLGWKKEKPKLKKIHWKTFLGLKPKMNALKKKQRKNKNKRKSKTRDNVDIIPATNDQNRLSKDCLAKIPIHLSLSNEVIEIDSDNSDSNRLQIINAKTNIGNNETETSGIINEVEKIKTLNSIKVQETSDLSNNKTDIVNDTDTDTNSSSEKEKNSCNHKNHLEQFENDMEVVSKKKQANEKCQDKNTIELENEKVLHKPETSAYNNMEKVVLSSDEINKQIRTQLKLLQMGKRSVSLLGDRNTSSLKTSLSGKTPDSSRSSTPSFSRNKSRSSLQEAPIEFSYNTLDTPTSQINMVTSTPNQTNTGTENTPLLNGTLPFLDNLLYKMRLTPQTTDQNISNVHDEMAKGGYVEKVISVSDTSNKLAPPISINEDDEHSNHSGSSANDFLGFLEKDTIRYEHPNIPGLLPTPIVKSSGTYSAFVSEELDNFMKENSLENSANIALPAKHIPDEAMMYSEARPPVLNCPQRSIDMEKPRTVAEKRMLLEKKTDIKYLIIENDYTVYRELRKRNKSNGSVNYRLLKDIQENDTPFTRDCWRAVCWLRTDIGKFFFQTVKFGNDTIKIHGSRGNNKEKIICTIPTEPLPKNIQSKCSLACKPFGNIKINGLEQIIPAIKKETIKITPNKKLNTLFDSIKLLKPCPLSRKKLSLERTSMDMELGPLEIYNLPKVQLEVWPKLNQPLPDIVKPYLKKALPFENITLEWAKFATSTLQVKPKPVKRKRKNRRNKKKKIEEPEPFIFDINYCNDQHKVLVRKRKTPISTIVNTTKPLVKRVKYKFKQNINPKDKVANEVADVLTGMINSVAISTDECFLIKTDPDGCCYKKDDVLVPTAPYTDNIHFAKKRGSISNKIVNELRRLNATIINANKPAFKKNCYEEFCKLGCICESLTASQSYTTHCGKVNCMFECKCLKFQNGNKFNNFHDIKQIREKATALLAKEEKDFTATVVLSENKTIYIPNSDYVGKRSKKIPKRFSDCVSILDTESGIKTVSISKDFCTSMPSNITDEEKYEKEANDFTIPYEHTLEVVDRMRHVTVCLQNLDILNEVIEPWCMIHCLYKCFCKLKATDGNRVEFSEDSLNTAIRVQKSPIRQSRKKQYSFSKDVQQEPLHKKLKTNFDNENNNLYVLVHNLCARTQMVDTKRLRERNKRKFQSVKLECNRLENKHKILLNNRIKECLVGFIPERLDISLENFDPESTIEKVIPKPNQHSIQKDTESKTTSAIEQSNLIEPISQNVHLIHQPQNSTAPVSLFEPTISMNGSSNTPAEKNKHINNVQRLNYMVSKTMQSICSIQQKNTKNLMAPVAKALISAQWKNVIEAFNEDLIYVWQIQLDNNDGFLAVTIQNVQPYVSNATYIINIKAVLSERLFVLAQMLKLGIKNEQTDHLAVLMLGASNYWRIIGFIHSKHKYLYDGIQVKPTPGSHPLLSRKISSLFAVLTNRHLNSKTNTSQISLINGNTESPTKICAKVGDKCNIPLINLKQKDLESIYVPIPIIGAHRWFMLILKNDFTHIYIPSWKNFLSYAKIQNALQFAQRSKKTVKISTPSLAPDVYAAHNEDNKIFFGPYKVYEPLNLTLHQIFEGRMLLIEDYEKHTNQPRSSQRTTGCWLYMKDDQIVNDSGLDLDNEQDDDDCIIVEPNATNTIIEVNDSSTINSPTQLCDKPQQTSINVSEILEINDEEIIPVHDQIAVNDIPMESMKFLILSKPKKPSPIPTQPREMTVEKTPDNATDEIPIQQQLIENNQYNLQQNYALDEDMFPMPFVIMKPRNNDINSEIQTVQIPQTSISSFSIIPTTDIVTPSPIQQLPGVINKKKFLLSTKMLAMLPKKTLLPAYTIQSSSTITPTFTISPTFTMSSSSTLPTWSTIQKSIPIPQPAVMPLPTKLPLVLKKPRAVKVLQPATMLPPIKIPPLTKRNWRTLMPKLKPNSSIINQPPPLTLISSTATSEISKAPNLNTHSLVSVQSTIENLINAQSTTTNTITSSFESFSISNVATTVNNPNFINLSALFKPILKKPYVPLADNQIKITEVKDSNKVLSSTPVAFTNIPSASNVSISRKLVSTALLKHGPKEVQNKLIIGKLNDKPSISIIRLPPHITTVDSPNIQTNNIDSINCTTSQTENLSVNDINHTSSVNPPKLPKDLVIIPMVKEKNITSIELQKLLSTPAITSTITQTAKIAVKKRKLIPSTTIPSTITQSTIISVENHTLLPTSTITQPNIISIKKPTLLPTSTITSTITQPTNTITNNTFVSKNEEIIDLSDEEDVPPLKKSKKAVKIFNSTSVTRGYLVSNIISLGKIRAELRPDGIMMKLPTMTETVKVNGISNANEYLNLHIRQQIFGFVPQDMHVTWRFVSEPKDHIPYQIQTSDTLKLSSVLTNYDIIDLKSDFEANSKLPKKLIDHLLVLKLANACMDRAEIRKKTGLEIIDKAAEYIKKLTVKEGKLENLKMYYKVKIHLNNLKLEELNKEKVISNKLENVILTTPPVTTSNVIVIDDSD